MPGPWRKGLPHRAPRTDIPFLASQSGLCLPNRPIRRVRCLVKVLGQPLTRGARAHDSETISGLRHYGPPSHRILQYDSVLSAALVYHTIAELNSLRTVVCYPYSLLLFLLPPNLRSKLSTLAGSSTLHALGTSQRTISNPRTHTLGILESENILHYHHSAPSASPQPSSLDL